MSTGALISNPHEGVACCSTWKKEEVVLVNGTYDFFHYKCDGFNDVGWGCGYRTLQTMCSWVLRCHGSTNVQNKVPNIPAIQKVLVDIQDKTQEFIGSRDWIGSLEVGYVLNTLYNIDFRILNVTGRNDWQSIVCQLSQHLKDGGCPVMMGGSSDAASKCIIGTHANDHLLVLDPHVTSTSATRKSVSWHSTEEFSLRGNDFYNFCVPLIKWEL